MTFDDTTTTMAQSHSSQSMVLSGAALNFNVLFDSWSVQTDWQLGVTLAACFLMGFVYEGLKVLRAVHFQKRGFTCCSGGIGQTLRKAVSITKPRSSSYTEETALAEELNEAHYQKAESPPPDDKSQLLRNKSTINTGICSLFHFVQSGLFMIEVTLGFLIMLALMSFSVWVFVSIILGLTISYFSFGHWLTMHSPGDGESC